MSNEVVPLTLQILDNEYRIACPESEHAALTAAANKLNIQMQEIRDSGKVLGVERIAVMAALDAIYELLKCRKEIEELGECTNQRLEELLNRLEIALEKSTR